MRTLKFCILYGLDIHMFRTL